MDNYETLLSGGEEDFDFSTLLADDETQQTSFDNNQQQIPTVIDPNAIYALPSDMSTFDFYNPMSDNQNPSVTFQTTTPIIPVMFNNNYAPAMLQNMHPSMFSNAFFGAFNTSPTQQFMTGSVSSNSLSPIGTQTTTDQSSTSGQSSGASTSKKKTPARKKKKTSSDSKSTKQTSSGSENEEEKMRKKAAANGKKRDAEEIDADMKRLMTLENAEDLTEQQKEEKKKLRNRYTAKVSRDRKKKELETLRDENHGLQKKLDEASVTIKTLKDQNEKLVQQNQYLQSQLAVVYSSYSMSAANNPDNRKGNTIMRSAVILLGIVLVFTVFTFLTGSFSYNSSAKTSSFTSSSPQPEQKTARRLARGLLSINGSNSDHPPNYGSRSATPPPVESVGSKTLPTQSSSHSHSVNQHLPEPIYVENTMEMGESLEEDFNPDGMMSYDVFYPSKLKRHFSSFSYQNPKQNASEAAHIRNYDNSTSASPVPKKKKSVTSQRHNNSKQISVLTKPTMLSKRIEEKKHKYERATVYVPSENNIPSDKSELHMFCPYLYPLVAGVPDTGYEFSTKDFETSKKSSMKIHIPIQMVCNKTNAKVIRMAEINAENITLSDVFYEFNGPSLPPRSVVTN